MAEECLTCKSTRLVHIDGKTSDACYVQFGEKSRDGYVPGDMGIGGGDYISFILCLNCGQIQDTFPVPPTSIETGKDE